MRCVEAQSLMDLYLTDDPLLGSGERLRLEGHLRECPPCRAAYERGCQVVDLVRRYGLVSADTLALLEGRRGAGTPVRALRIRYVVRVAVAAACLVLAVLGGWFGWHTEARKSRPGGPVASSREATVLLETSDGRRVLPGAAIQTAVGEVRSLVLNGRHRVIMNADTQLSIEPLGGMDQVGCLVNLDRGEVCVDVEHDGRPFAIRTTHGRAIVTGTTLDVRTTHAGTALVVVEGSVRFQSQAGVVDVPAGRRSMIRAASAPPAAPTACDALALTDWARTTRSKGQVTQVADFQDVSFDDLPLFPPADTRMELGNLRYAEWVAQNHDWFQRQFPSIFRLQAALGREGIKVDYADLLLESGLLWQFAYPPAGRDRFLEADDAALIRAASSYGRDLQWLTDTGQLPRVCPVADGQRQMGEAFALWRQEIAATRAFCDEDVPMDVLLNSLQASVYLRQTRSLLWLAVETDRYSKSTLPKAQLQALLQTQVAAAESNVGDLIRILTAERPARACQDSPHRPSLGDLSVAVARLALIQEQLTEGTP